MGRPWIVDFEHWAQHDHDAMIAYLRDPASDVAGLTFAAEATRGCTDHRVVDAVVDLIEHPSPVVRDGVLLGLQDTDNAAIRLAVAMMSMSDPSRGVRETASDLVAEWTDDS